MLHAIVHPADIQDRDGGILVMATLFGMFPFLKTLFADGGYQGPQFAKAAAKALPHLEIEIVKRSDRVKGFVVLPQRWIVERTIAWLNRCRKLAKDWENLNRKALAFLRRHTGPLVIMPSADQVPVNNPHSIMCWHKWGVLIAGSAGSAARANQCELCPQ